jgi:hypothetical protein
MTRPFRTSPLTGTLTSKPPPVARSGRTLLIVGAIGLLFALVQLTGAWQVYRDPVLVLGFWLALSAALLLMAWIVARHGGEVAGQTVVPMIGLLVAADVVVPADTMTGRIGAAGWNWGVVAILLLALAVYRPVLEVMLLCLAHAGAVLAWAVLAGEGVDPGTAVLVGAGAVIPPMVAAQFIHFYVGILSEREQAGRRAAQIEAREAAEAVVERDGQRRLARIRASVLPVLRHAGSGAPIPLDAEHAEAARLAAARLRSQLLAGREVGWLLSGATGRVGQDDDVAVEVQVVTDAAARQVLDDDLRSAVASLVSLLRRHRPWNQLAVTLTARQRSGLAITVVATGDCAVVAARDPAIQTAVQRLGVELSVVDERIVVIEGVVAVVAASAGADIV